MSAEQKNPPGRGFDIPDSGGQDCHRHEAIKETLQVTPVDMRLSGRPSGVDQHTRIGNPGEPAPFNPPGGNHKEGGRTAPTNPWRPYETEAEWTRMALFDAMPVCDPEWERYLEGGEEPSWWKQRKPPLMRPVLPSAGLSLEDALNQLGRVRPKGDEWHALCPVHEDHNRSLIISESDYKPGEPVFYCYAGCTHAQVKAKLEEMCRG